MVRFPTPLAIPGDSKMPRYEYSCDTCGLDFEVLQKLSDPILKTKEGCKGNTCQLRKKMSTFAGQIAGQMSASSMDREMPLETAFSRALPENDPVHLCSKYCSHHTKNGT